MYSAVRLGHFTELTRGLTATAVCKVDLSHWKATKEERAFASPSFTNRGEIFSEGASTCAFYKIKRNFPNSTYNRMSTYNRKLRVLSQNTGALYLEIFWTQLKISEV